MYDKNFRNLFYTSGSGMSYKMLTGSEVKKQLYRKDLNSTGTFIVKPYNNEIELTVCGLYCNALDLDYNVKLM